MMVRSSTAARPLCGDSAVFKVALSEHDDELFAAPARRKIGGALHATQGLANARKHLIPRCVTETIVDHLEVIDVQEEYGNR
jgi:hypothetical protein